MTPSKRTVVRDDTAFEVEESLNPSTMLSILGKRE